MNRANSLSLLDEAASNDDCSQDLCFDWARKPLGLGRTSFVDGALGRHLGIARQAVTFRRRTRTSSALCFVPIGVSPEGLDLALRMAMFEPVLHSGEAMAAGMVGTTRCCT